jgi:hypothetical protein
MTRLALGSAAAALLVVACGLDASPSGSPVPSASSLSADAAGLTVTGSGERCGPWWMGCGAFLAIEPPGWTLPNDWAPSADDTQFAVQIAAGDDGPARVTGIWRLGQDQIEPGRYRFVGILTTSPDNASPGTWYPSLGCGVEVEVPAGTQTVGVAVVFTDGQDACTIAVSMDVATPAPSS